MNGTCIVKYLGQKDYESTWQAMKDFTDNRTPETEDELWVVEHPPVFTIGQAGKSEHLLKQTNIPVIQVDRGGQITYHGPGQIVVYTLINVKRKGLGVRELVTLLETSTIDLLRHYDITAEADPKAPGVYVNEAKICAIGLRIRRGCSFHGLALNVKMDLTPYDAINPCGYPGMQVTQMADFLPKIEIKSVSAQLIAHLMSHLGYNAAQSTG